MNGNGIYTYPDGSKYEGDWEDNKKHGKGIYYYNNELWKGDKYEGDWENDNQHGKGIYYYNNEPIKGDKYEGEWQDNKRHGKGIYYYFSNGNSVLQNWNSGCLTD